MTDGWLDDREAINAFLRFGYVPDDPDLDPYLRDVDFLARSPDGDTALLHRGETALSEAFDRSLADVKGDTHVIPLSGGLDSRAILGELLRRVGNDRVRTVTFGVPGTWDYDIPKRIAERFDLDATFIPLDSGSLRWSNELVFEHCDPGRPVPVVERTVNRLSQERIAGENTVYWSGFNIETGAIAMNAPESWDRAVADFVNDNTVAGSLTAPAFDPASVLPSEPIVPREVLPFDQQLDYAFRQEYYSKPLLFPADCRPLALPFTELPWREFCLALPVEHRRERRTFERILQRRYPALFALPVDSNSGMRLDAPAPLPRLKGLAHSVLERIPDPLGVHFSHPRRNYYEFDTFFARDEIRPWVKANLLDLTARDAVDWLQPLEVWDRYRGGASLGTEIRLLLSLEVYFKLRARSLEDRSHSQSAVRAGNL